MSSDAPGRNVDKRREKEESFGGRERWRRDRRLLWKKQLTLLLLDLRRISTLKRVGHSPADISMQDLRYGLKDLFNRKININCGNHSTLPIYDINTGILSMTTDWRAYSLWRRQSAQASMWHLLQDKIYLRCLVPHISQTLPWREPSSLVNLLLWSHSWFVCSSCTIASTRCWRMAGAKGHGASLLTTC
jgi:hypothetical protein